jgi:hypothetical protein
LSLGSLTVIEMVSVKTISNLSAELSAEVNLGDAKHAVELCEALFLGCAPLHVRLRISSPQPLVGFVPYDSDAVYRHFAGSIINDVRVWDGSSPDASNTCVTVVISYTDRGPSVVLRLVGGHVGVFDDSSSNWLKYRPGVSLFNRRSYALNPSAETNHILNLLSLAGELTKFKGVRCDVELTMATLKESVNRWGGYVATESVVKGMAIYLRRFSIVHGSIREAIRLSRTLTVTNRRELTRLYSRMQRQEKLPGAPYVSELPRPLKLYPELSVDEALNAAMGRVTLAQSYETMARDALWVVSLTAPTTSNLCPYFVVDGPDNSIHVAGISDLGPSGVRRSFAVDQGSLIIFRPSFSTTIYVIDTEPELWEPVRKPSYLYGEHSTYSADACLCALHVAAPYIRRKALIHIVDSIRADVRTLLKLPTLLTTVKGEGGLWTSPQNATLLPGGVPGRVRDVLGVEDGSVERDVVSMLGRVGFIKSSSAYPMCYLHALGIDVSSGLLRSAAHVDLVGVKLFGSPGDRRGNECKGGGIRKLIGLGFRTRFAHDRGRNSKGGGGAEKAALAGELGIHVVRVSGNDESVGAAIRFTKVGTSVGHLTGGDVAVSTRGLSSTLPPGTMVGKRSRDAGERRKRIPESGERGRKVSNPRPGLLPRAECGGIGLGRLTRRMERGLADGTRALPNWVLRVVTRGGRTYVYTDGVNRRNGRCLDYLAVSHIPRDLLGVVVREPHSEEGMVLTQKLVIRRQMTRDGNKSFRPSLRGVGVPRSTPLGMTITARLKTMPEGYRTARHLPLTARPSLSPYHRACTPSINNRGLRRVSQSWTRSSYRAGGGPPAIRAAKRRPSVAAPRVCSYGSGFVHQVGSDEPTRPTPGVRTVKGRPPRPSTVTPGTARTEC